MNVISVPFWTGVPAPVLDVDVGVVGVVVVFPFVGVVGVVGVVDVLPFSIAVATISISPFNGTTFAVGNSVITVPPGAVSGTLSHAEEPNMSEIAASVVPTRATKERFRSCASIRGAKDNTLMGLGGQGSRWRNEQGYAMAALLVMLAVMAVLMSVAMPVWRQQARREKEAELIFRGEQYARAIALYNFKMGPQGQRAGGSMYPPSIDVLVDGRYLRKKYKDPMTKDGEFVVIPATAPTMPGVQGGPPQTGQQPPQTGPQRGPQTGPQRGQPQSGFQPSPFQSPQLAGPQRGSTPGGQQLAIGGIRGVRSKSEENSLRSYRGQTRYDQWLFVSDNIRRPGGMPNAPGQNGPPNTGQRGQRGGPGTNNPPFPGTGTNPINRGNRGGPVGMPGTGTPRPGGRGPGL